jgi:hypothetical protein
VNTDTPLQDSDGDGVPDESDYAPNDPEVQEKADLQNNTKTSTDVDGFGYILGVIALLSGLVWVQRQVGAD